MIFYNTLRILLYPLTRLVLPLCISSLKKRLVLEKKYLYPYNYNEEAIFHVSSEGELEQSLPVIEKFSEKYKVLIVFTSPSVEKKVLDLKDRLSCEICALPILLYFPFIKKFNPALWSSKFLFMCRYDFFPELLSLARKSERSILLNVSFKSLLSAGSLKLKYYRYAYDSFDELILASEKEKEYFSKINFDREYKKQAFDFRIIQILKRTKKAKTTLENKIKNYDLYLNFLDKFKFGERVILGSYWDTEFDYLKNAFKEAQSKKSLVLCVPHLLSEDALKKIKNRFENESLKYIEISNDLSRQELEKRFSFLKESGGIVIVNLKGVLCELYTLAGNVYIAGGFHRSIHSVLEPYLAGSHYISCGKNIFRSSEYDLIQSWSPEQIKAFPSVQSFFPGDKIETTGINTVRWEEDFSRIVDGFGKL